MRVSNNWFSWNTEAYWKVIKLLRGRRWNGESWQFFLSLFSYPRSKVTSILLADDGHLRDVIKKHARARWTRNVLQIHLWQFLFVKWIDWISLQLKEKRCSLGFLSGWHSSLLHFPTNSISFKLYRGTA